ncbi:MAG: DNA double-strand break repair nuclease NurA [Candidatus Heimdallarchaeota archaeon]
MTSENLLGQCQQAFEQLKRIHRRATVRLVREREQIQPQFSEFDWNESPRPMIAIDGSYRELWHDSQTDSGLYLFRAAATTYKFSPPQELKLIDVESINRIALLSRDKGALLEEANGNLETELNAAILDFAGRGPREMTLVASGFQQAYELQLALRLAHETRGYFLALDGALATLKVPILQKQLQRLSDIADRNKHWLVGVTKANRTKSWNRIFTDEEVISQYAPLDMMAFSPWEPPRINWIERIGSSYFARLHPKALKWFRLDVFPETLSPALLFPELAQYSKDLRLPGYPVPLSEAHRICKMIRNVEIVPDHILLKAGLEAELSPDQLMTGLTDYHERVAGGFHERLDTMTK